MQPLPRNHNLRSLLSSHAKLLCTVGLALVLLSCNGGGDDDGTGQEIAVTVSPETATVEIGESQQFSATVTGSDDTSVAWSVSENNGGDIDADGLYTAPAQAGTYHVAATCNADTTISNGATVTVIPNASGANVTISPLSVDLDPQGTQQFSAQVTGTDDQSVAWSVEEPDGCGSITTEGLYSAPDSEAICHVRATSTADDTSYAVATISIGSVERTVITIGDTVTVADIKRLGVNLGEDVWYNGAHYTKERIRNGGFEGILYRTMGYGPTGTATTYLDWWDISAWNDLVIDASAWFVSGPRKWEELTITDQGTSYYAPQDRDLQSYTFTPSGTAPIANDGFLIESNQDHIGFIGQHGGAYWVFTDGNAGIATATGDVRPGSNGRIAAVLTATDSADVARLLAPLTNEDAMDVSGTWQYSLWAKGSGTLTLALADWGHQGPNGHAPRTAQLTDSWQQITGTIELASYPQGWNGSLSFSIHHTGGIAKIDEVSVIKQGDTNPTPFSDDLVNLLMDLQPGSLRHLQIGGSSIDNVLRPRPSRMAYTHRRGDQPADGTWPGHPDTNGQARTHSYGLHEFLQLCEQVGTDPWYCTSGTLKQNELVQLIEYLGGSTDTTMGQLRADRGHPSPWTDVFDTIHIEIGNEAWNNGSAWVNGGYNGQEYWSDLFASAKATPHYSPKIRFHAGGQSVNTWLNTNLAQRHGDQADALALAPYILHSMTNDQAGMSDEELYSWIYGYTWYNSRQGYMQNNFDQVAQPFGMDLSIYEVNHHITGGDAPVEVRNKLVSSIGGALNVSNWMLLMLQNQQVRTQNIFTLIQDSYNDIRLWGIVLSMQEGQERYRPLYLAARMINRALSGDLVQVGKSGADPTWNCAFTYDDSNQPPGDIPYIHGYATRDGSRRGLILINLHRTDSLPLTIDLPNSPVGGQAQKYELTGPTINANNEPEHAPQVSATHTTLSDFNPHYSMQMQPHSLVVLTWED